ncbi:hypothetical protein ONE63_010460 [Megalurothrips usitatus]|uniref:Uncharacterized protein n=1 Tax=Megalurothrips usitatus TaxID=439358 RepID=A0AAV7XGQ7_9NEOP|nr:hypothetical protein ONE63_010460 [Megalurothrips usitatus]
MMKMQIAVVFACLVAASSAQILLGSDTTYSHESTAQQHSPWSASASSRSQVHGPDAALVAAAPVHLVHSAPIVHSAPLLAAAPVAIASPLVHSVPLAYLRR